MAQQEHHANQVYYPDHGAGKVVGHVEDLREKIVENVRIQTGLFWTFCTFWITTYQNICQNNLTKETILRRLKAGVLWKGYEQISSYLLQIAFRTNSLPCGGSISLHIGSSQKKGGYMCDLAWEIQSAAGECVCVCETLDNRVYFWEYWQANG